MIKFSLAKSISLNFNSIFHDWIRFSTFEFDLIRFVFLDRSFVFRFRKGIRVGCTRVASGIFFSLEKNWKKKNFVLKILTDSNIKVTDTDTPDIYIR